jgi:sarcosine/dimethylglycine N-methyltransferase
VDFTRSAADRARLEAAQKTQMATYSQADGAIWRHAVYDVLHDGWELACLGGRTFLDDMIASSGITAASSVLELGCGSGAACHYVAEATGCRVTGVEVNPDQLQRARNRRGSVTRGSLSFLLADIDQFSAVARYDVVFQLDTFSLLPSMPRALAAARRVLANSGSFYMADLVAGPNFTRDVEEYAREIDGFSSLLAVDELQLVLQESGFVDIDKRDHTEQGASGNAAILSWLEHPPTPLPDGITPAALQGWRTLVQYYYESFRSRALGYYWWKALPRH